MKPKEPIIYTLEQVGEVAKKIITSFGDDKLYALTGDLGAGKTTLIKAICEILEVEDVVSSPTFSIINEYRTKNNSTIYHLDLYRLEDGNEAENIGIEDYLYSNHLAFVEWPQVVDYLLPENTIRIHIENIDESTRKMLFL